MHASLSNYNGKHTLRYRTLLVSDNRLGRPLSRLVSTIDGVVLTKLSYVCAMMMMHARYNRCTGASGAGSCEIGSCNGLQEISLEATPWPPWRNM